MRTKILPFSSKRLTTYCELAQACEDEIIFLGTPIKASTTSCCSIFSSHRKNGQYKKFLDEDGIKRLIAHLNSVATLARSHRGDFYRAIDVEESDAQEMLLNLFEQIDTTARSNAADDDSQDIGTTHSSSFKEKLDTLNGVFYHPTFTKIKSETTNYFIIKERLEEESKYKQYKNPGMRWN